MAASLLVLAAAILIAAASRRSPHSLRGMRRIWQGINLPCQALQEGGDSLLQQVKKSIGYDRLQETVDLLIVKLPPAIVKGAAFVQLLHLQGRICSTENEWRKHNITFEEYEVSRNRQRLTLIQYCDELFSFVGFEFGEEPKP
jgi:hypothetical protein